MNTLCTFKDLYKYAYNQYYYYKYKYTGTNYFLTYYARFDYECMQYINNSYTIDCLNDLVMAIINYKNKNERPYSGGYGDYTYNDYLISDLFEALHAIEDYREFRELEYHNNNKCIDLVTKKHKFFANSGGRVYTGNNAIFKCNSIYGLYEPIVIRQPIVKYLNIKLIHK